MRQDQWLSRRCETNWAMLPSSFHIIQVHSILIQAWRCVLLYFRCRWVDCFLLCSSGSKKTEALNKESALNRDPPLPVCLKCSMSYLIWDSISSLVTLAGSGSSCADGGTITVLTQPLATSTSISVRTITSPNSELFPSLRIIWRIRKENLSASICVHLLLSTGKIPL